VHRIALGKFAIQYQTLPPIRPLRQRASLPNMACEIRVALAPDVILAAGSATVEALQQATRTVPIVFGRIIDPVGFRTFTLRNHVHPFAVREGYRCRGVNRTAHRGPI
jgi:hypothetical protein